MIKKRNIAFSILSISLLFFSCINQNTKNDFLKNNIEIKEANPIIEKVPKEINFEEIFNTLVIKLKPEIATEEEFINFKKNSNYIQTIESYDSNNPSMLLGDIKNKDNISYYALPTEINKQEYGNNSILFGDLNSDGKRDCIISVIRSDGYNEVTFFYVFINNGTAFKLEDVTNEDAICGCIKEGWPSKLRYQKIEGGYLIGMSQCHYQDAHCCPSIYFKTKVKFENGKLQFHSSEFVMDDAIQYRPTPHLDSVLVKSKI